MSAQASLGLDTGPFSLVPNETDSPVAAIASDEIFETKTLEIVAYTVLFVLGAPANLRVLFILLKAKCFKKSRHHLLLLHLALADSLVSVLMIPVEIGWRVTNRWVAGEIACKAFQFLRVFGPYSSSLVLICISLDRYYAVMDPFNYASCQTDSKIKKMLWFIWGLAAALSLPQVNRYAAMLPCATPVPVRRSSECAHLKAFIDGEAKRQRADSQLFTTRACCRAQIRTSYLSAHEMRESESEVEIDFPERAYGAIGKPSQLPGLEIGALCRKGDGIRDL